MIHVRKNIRAIAFNKQSHHHLEVRVAAEWY